jgi:hypothetical protein
MVKEERRQKTARQMLGKDFHVAHGERDKGLLPTWLVHDASLHLDRRKFYGLQVGPTRCLKKKI